MSFGGMPCKVFSNSLSDSLPTLTPFIALGWEIAKLLQPRTFVFCLKDCSLVGLLILML